MAHFSRSARDALPIGHIDLDERDTAGVAQFFRRGLTRFHIARAEKNAQAKPSELTRYLKPDSLVRAGHKRRSLISHRGETSHKGHKGTQRILIFLRVRSFIAPQLCAA
jgi:hypothetical protein